MISVENIYGYVLRCLNSTICTDLLTDISKLTVRFELSETTCQSYFSDLRQLNLNFQGKYLYCHPAIHLKKSGTE